MSLDSVLLKYFTEEELIKLKPKLTYSESENDINVADIRFSIKGDELLLKEFPAAKYGYEVPLDRDDNYRAWEGVAFIKVRIINSAEDIINRARTGDLYDESYYTSRGGGGPYTNYPYRFDGVSEEDRFKELAQEILDKYGKSSILDCGCATGVLVKPLQELGFEASGFDISEFAIQNGICPNLYLADGRNLPFKDGEFDLLISQDFMEHIHPDDLPDVLSEQKRILKKGGIALHFIPFYKEFATPVQIDAHLCNANKQWWEQFLTQLDILKVEYAPSEDGQWDYSDGILPKYFILRNV